MRSSTAYYLLLTTCLAAAVFGVIKAQSSSHHQTNKQVEEKSHNVPVESDFKDESTYLGKGFFTVYDSEDGMALDVVSWGGKSVFCDSRGHLWIGTSGGGVSRYDGISFENFSINQGLVHNLVRCILEDSQGNLWFGTAGGVSKFDGRSFINYTEDNGLLGYTVMGMYEDDSGKIWMATDEGICVFDGETFEHHIPITDGGRNSFYSVVQDRNGDLWFSSFDYGLFRYDGKKFERFGEEEGVTNEKIFGALRARNGDVWWATFEGLFKYDGKKFTHFKKEEIGAEALMCIVEDKNGKLWIGTSGDGVIEYDGKNFNKYTIENGLSENLVYGIEEDKRGNIWMGTYGGGITKFSGKSITHLSVEHGLGHHVVWTTEEYRDGKLWFGTSSTGIRIFDGKTIVPFNKVEILETAVIRCIERDSRDDMWIGTANVGVTKYDGKSAVTYRKSDGLPGDRVYCIDEDKNGHMWFGIYDAGISRFDGESFTNFSLDEGLGHKRVIAIKFDDSDNLWIGTWGGGMSIYDGNKFVNHSTKSGLGNDFVTCFLKRDNGDIWAGTYGGGISIMTFENGKIVEKNRITTAEGLHDDGVSSLEVDKSGNVIVGTNTGIAVIPDGDIANGIEEYSLNTEYPIRDVNGGSNNGAIFCDSRNIIWIGTGSERSSLVRFDYSEVNKETKDAKVLIQNININGEKVSWYSVSEMFSMKEDSVVLQYQELINYGRVLNNTERDSLRTLFADASFTGISKFNALPENLVLPYGLNDISFDFKAVETSRGAMVKYQYKLEGEDADWNAITDKREAIYNNLNEGDYKFLVRARNPEGIWSESSVFEFKVLPPWYRTWWAFGCYVIILFLLIWMVVRLQTMKLKKRQSELRREVSKATYELQQQSALLAHQKEELSKKHEEKVAMMREIHHRVKNNLQVVNSLLRMQSREVKDERIVSMFEECQNRVLSMALIHEKMYRSGDLTHIDIKEHLTLLVEDLIRNYQVGNRITLNIEIDSVDIGLKTLVPLGLIINELIANSLKYAFKDREGGEIKVELHAMDNNKFELIVGDDGIGMNSSTRNGRSMGSELVQIFTEQLEGSIELLEGEGTVHRIVFEGIDHEQ